ncbi:MAG: S-adenosylmethionine:tRNA ribosyltransferase-isomerase, partial [Candidatus Binatia bacterium]
MRVSEFDYPLPRELIAKRPRTVRGGSRLMVLERGTRSASHARFADLTRWLRPGDLLVRNDTRVIRARLRGQRDGGGEVEVLLLRAEAKDGGDEIWTCLARPGRRLRQGQSVHLPGELSGIWLDEGNGDGIRRIRLRSETPILEVLERAGEVPLPPYLERRADDEDADAYQTVYARIPGSVAAPTAGLHFTDQIFSELASAGIEIRSLTLHVGAATFLPFRGERIEDQSLPAEPVAIPAETAVAVASAKREGRRVVAVGTTTVRALEAGLADLVPK